MNIPNNIVHMYLDSCWRMYSLNKLANNQARDSTKSWSLNPDQLPLEDFFETVSISDK